MGKRRLFLFLVTFTDLCCGQEYLVKVLYSNLPGHLLLSNNLNQNKVGGIRL